MEWILGVGARSLMDAIICVVGNSKLCGQAVRGTEEGGFGSPREHNRRRVGASRLRRRPAARAGNVQPTRHMHRTLAAAHAIASLQPGPPARARCQAQATRPMPAPPMPSKRMPRRRDGHRGQWRALHLDRRAEPAPRRRPCKPPPASCPVRAQRPPRAEASQPSAARPRRTPRGPSAMRIGESSRP